MKKLLVSIFALTAISAAIAAPVSMEDQSQLKPAPAKADNEQYHIIHLNLQKKLFWMNQIFTQKA